MRKRLLVLAFGIMFIFTANAQETTSEITGLVSGDKAPLSGATVVALHTPSGSTYKTTTRSDGRFNLPNVRIGGPYTVTVSYVGFQTGHQEGIMLVLGQEFKADFALANDSKQLNEVVVTASGGKVFNSSHTGNQEIITRAQMERLPTVNRSLLDFTRLSPVSNGLSFGGQSSQYNNLTVDGANFNNSFGLSGTLGGQTNSQPISLDAIEQIQVNVSPYDVRQGGFSGAGINSVTRSGTNQFRGSLYTYIKGPGTQGYKVGDITVPHQDYSYNLTGFSVGGPIIENKLFLFVSGEQEKRTDPGTTWQASTPGNPANGVSVSNASASSLDALKAFLKAAPYNYDPGDYQGYTYKTESKKLTIRLDWNINQANTLTLKYNFLKSSRQAPPSNSGSVNTSYGRAPGNYAMPFFGAGYTINNNFDIFIAELNTRLSNKASNKLQIGYTALRDFRNPLTSSPFPLVDILDGSGNPFTSFGYEQYTYNNLLNTDVWQLNDIFTFYKGNHELTVGFQGSYKKYENGFSPSYQGVYRFNSLADFYASAADPSVKAARYDLSYTLPPNSTFPLVGPESIELGFFAQDKWRIKPNFTLTLGLRVDIPVFKNTFLQNDSAAALTFYGGVPEKALQLNTGKAPNVNPIFGPRVGFNWDVNGDQKTQIRGGFGLFAGPPPFVWISNQASNSGVALFGSISNSTTASFSPDVNPNPNWPANTTKSLSKSYSINVTDPSFKYPQAFKSSLAVDQKLPKNWIVTLEFTYAKDVNAVFFQNVNLPAGTTPLVGADDRGHYATSQIYPVGGSAAASVSNPNIGNAIYMTNVNGGYAYTATVQIQKNFKNLYVNLAYTYSQAKDVMVGGSTAATMWGSKPISGNPNDPNVGYSNSYMPHRVIASASYRFVYGKYFATTVGLLFEAAPSGVGSYVYNGDLNGDAQTSNDLIYIPTVEDHTSGKYITAGGGGADTRTPEQVWDQINAYITQDKYLNGRRGKYAERNALVFPWYKRLDANVTQDIYMKVGKHTHTIRLSMDIVNVGNLINKDWGVYQIPSAGTGSSLLGGGVPNVINASLISAKVGAGNVPVYGFPYQVASSQTPYTKSFKDDTSLASRWQMQFGIRYLFN